MKGLILWTLGFSIFSGTALAQAMSPRDFAYAQMAILSQDAAAYRFSLPLAVYQSTFSEDLADIRVFNAEGLAVPFSLSRPAAQSASSPTEPARATLDVIGTRDPKNTQEYTFDLNAHPPVSRIDVELPEANTVVDIALSSRRLPGDPWRPVTRAGFYRVKTADGEQQNELLEIGVDGDRYWQARILNTGGLPKTLLRLHVEWIPNELTFLAQGHAPFLLVYGNASAARAEADLSRLPSTLEIAPATLGPSQVSGGAARLIAKPAPFPRMRVALWSVLLLAVVLLSWMAYRISKETDGAHPK